MDELSLGAVILAGGLARRMDGRDKGLLELNGRAMIAHVLDAVRPQVQELVINANRNESVYAAYGEKVVADRHAGHLGPLAGLSAGFDALASNYLFMCPCDSPFVSGELINRLWQAVQQDPSVDAAVAHDGDRLQPVFSIVHRRAQASLDAFLGAGERKIDRWYDSLKMIAVDCRSLPECFENINTEADRQAAEAVLEGRG